MVAPKLNHFVQTPHFRVQQAAEARPCLNRHLQLAAQTATVVVHEAGHSVVAQHQPVPAELIDGGTAVGSSDALCGHTTIAFCYEWRLGINAGALLVAAARGVALERGPLGALAHASRYIISALQAGVIIKVENPVKLSSCVRCRK